MGKFPLQLALIVLSLGAVLPASADTVLRGNVAKEGFGEGRRAEGFSAPSLSREDLRKGRDPFRMPAASQESDTDLLLEAPKEAFQSPPDLPIPPRQTFPLGAETDDYPLSPMSASPDAQPAGMSQTGGVEQSSFPPAAGEPLAGEADANDPDNSPDLQLAWDAWHRRVAEAIFNRYNTLSRSVFQYAPPLALRVSYVVTRDCRVTGVRVLASSGNIMFDALINQIIKSFNGDSALLTFPEGSRRMSVTKFGTFTQNYGAEGFRYTTGDRETLRAPQRR